MAGSGSGDPGPDLEPFALISLEEARGFLQKREREDKQDEEIIRLINAASEEIIDWTKREFAPSGTELETRAFDYDGGRHIDLYPFDVREVTGVVVGADLDQPLELAPSDWRPRPLSSRHGVHQLLRLKDSARAKARRLGECEVEVTGTWGFAAVPENVQHWCKVTVATWLRKDVSAFSTTLRLEQDRLERPDALPTAVVRGLQKYRRDRIVTPR